MTKHFTLLLFSFFAFAGIVSAQDLVFIQDGKELQEGSTVYCSKIDVLGAMNPHIYVKNKGADVSASLTITVLEEPAVGDVGFCGWEASGIDECRVVPYGSPITKTTTISTNQEIDTKVEIMNVDPSNTLIRVQYKLAYSDQEKTLTVIFTTDPPSSSIPTFSKETTISLYHKDGNVCMDYSFANSTVRKIILYNIVGKKVAQYILTDHSNTLIFPSLPKGIYMYSVIENNKPVKSGKYIF